MPMAKNRIFSALLTVLMLVTVLPVTGYAVDPIDPEREATLTVWFHDGNKNLPNVSFDLYRVADAGRFAEFTLTGDFAGYPVEINGLDAAGWKAAAQTLSGYVRRDNIAPLDHGATNREGRVTFPTGETRLTAGLYLLMSQPKTVGGSRYTQEPQLISLPNRAEEDHQWSYDVLISPKFSKTPEDSPGSRYVERKVLKVWKDGEGGNRPQSIRVQLLKNGKVEETVTLSAKNNWRYSWDNLDAAEEWQVVEKETPEGYKVTVTREGITFVMTNTWDEPEEPPKEPPGKPPEEPPEEPPEPGTEIPEEPVPKGPKLPQTGQLWWPVPLLALAGMALFLAGWMRKDRRSEG